MTDKPLPPGWHIMLQAPAPGKKRKFLFQTPTGERVESFFSSLQFNETTLSPIAWRYA